VYGNDHFLFRSAIFWFGLLITVLLALLPRYLYIAWSFGFNPNDLDILNWNYKIKPNMDLIHEAYLHSGKVEERVLESAAPRSESPTQLGRPSMQASHIDMSTGERSQSRGYSFAQEENGVAMRRMQSNLSGALPLTSARKSRGTALLRSIRHPLRRKQPPGEP
jgi:phospholipid-translocating ATPase